MHLVLGPWAVRVVASRRNWAEFLLIGQREWVVVGWCPTADAPYRFASLRTRPCAPSDARPSGHLPRSSAAVHSGPIRRRPPLALAGSLHSPVPVPSAAQVHPLHRPVNGKELTPPNEQEGADHCRGAAHPRALDCWRSRDFRGVAMGSNCRR